MRFQPGNQLGKGRPPIKDSVTALLRSKLPAEQRADMLIKLAQEAEDERVRLQATLAIIDRTDGKVKDVVEMQSSMSDEDYREELAHIAREHLASLSLEERAKLLSNTEPTVTVQ